MNIKSFSAISISMLVLSGCSTETTESKGIQTDAIWADIYVTSQGKDSRVIAELNVSSRNGNNIKLSNNDKLQASALGVTKDLEIDDSFLDIDYRANFNVADKDTKFTVTFSRSETNDIIRTNLNLPAPFTIFTPQQNQSFYKTDTVDVSWTADTATDTRLDVVLSVRCKNNEGNEQSIVESFRDIQDDGNLSIDLASLEGFEQDILNTKKACQGDVYIERIRYSTVPSEYAQGSRARAIQERYSDTFEVLLSR
ncbi:hypothetical protein L1077_13740 [Pseudoalteromonas luteoviolacea]|uniref:hypothetical protein n=1 Tax=Pseudoalteromonas luteoviolacea TaxID=43657 RepID=UPI001F4505D6|nr:hypothetical protein [Pseudoalteromonas luteoviolacea]MCF6440494.1 hypothetical protein [Pseudoalteromonas luteoviolacea]